MNACSLLTVCASPLLQMGLRELLAAHPGLRLAGEATTAGEAMKMNASLRPDAVVVAAGAGLGDGLAVVRELHRVRRALPLLVICQGGDSGQVQRAMEAGAQGFVTQADGTQEVLLALAAVRVGSTYISQSAKGGLQVRATRGSPAGMASPVCAGAMETSGLAGLSGREREVFTLLGSSLGCKGIAAQLSISVKTVETHCKRIKEKLGLVSSAEMHRVAKAAVAA